MSSLRECVLCGRRGVRDFEALDGLTWRCLNRGTCERRQRDAAQDRPVEPAAVDEAPKGKYATAGAVAGVARELDALRRAVRQLGGLSMQVEDLARVVGELAEQASTQATGCGSQPVVAPSWLDMPGNVEAAAGLLQDLTGWLGDVYLRYPDAARGLPDCWLWHPEVVEELLWLMYAWHAAYRDERATVALAGDWHDRYRPGVVRRVQELTKHCSLENHQPGDGARPVVPLAEALAPMAEWWSTGRADGPPEPTAEQLREAAARDRQFRGGRR